MWLYRDTLKYSQPSNPSLSLFCGRVALSSATPTNALSEERDKRERERERLTRDLEIFHTPVRLSGIAELKAKQETCLN